MTVRDEVWLIVLAAAPPALLACGFVPWVARGARRWGLLDHPSARKVHAVPKPLGGGLAIWASLITCYGLGSLAVWWWSRGSVPSWLPSLLAVHLPGVLYQLPRLWSVLGAATLLVLLGWWDDARGVPWTWRLATQLIVAGGCVSLTPWRLTVFIESPPVTWLLSVLWIVALINAFNMLDNMDGLSSGVAVIASFILGLGLLMLEEPGGGGPQLFVAGLLFSLSGAVAGFWWHNRYPSRLFMGDAGSYLIGFLIAVATMLATYTTYDGSRRHAVIAPLVVMAVPFYDMVSVIAIRLREGRSPFHADKCHFSHRLVALGFHPALAVGFIHLLTLATGLAALVLLRTDQLGALLVLALVGAIVTLIGLLEWVAAGKRGDASPAEAGKVAEGRTAVQLDRPDGE